MYFVRFKRNVRGIFEKRYLFLHLFITTVLSDVNKRSILSSRKGRSYMDNIEKIKKLKEEKNAIILAHYYVDEEVQKIADYIGDSFYLAKVASQTEADRIVTCCR